MIRQKFKFRAWMSPNSCDDLEVWIEGFEETEPTRRTNEAWIAEAMKDVDIHEKLGLSQERHWQVVGKGTITVYDEWSFESDHDLYLCGWEVQEVREDWYRQRVDYIDEVSDE